MTKYFDKPTQVKFKDHEAEGEDARWLGGIGYDHYILCGECGSLLDLDNYVYDEVEIKELPWISISEAIIGGDADDED